jgi:coenzyme F420-reducing hydrogenase beta subunit
MIMDVKNCFGCSACAQICPQQCIRMIPDVEGFEYPSVDESACIKCGLCYEVCPSLKDTLFETAESQKFYAFVYKDRNIVEQSSSGGAFTAIAEAFCNVGSYKIFGAKWNDDFSVSHSSINDVSDIDIFRKSKYLQSEIGNSYIEVENALKDGQTVVFSGTPCQVAGLKSFLKKDYDRLLLLDIICHGVPSKLIFQQYIKSLEKKSQSYMSHIYSDSERAYSE